MDIKKTDRSTLKSYFVRNAVPTAGNFAELVDGVLNQREDGIAKLPGEPLSVQADGDDASQKKLINFYRSFADAKPAWTLSLNPRANPADATTAKPGWSVGDADGNSRLFIDQATGSIGVGSVTPTGTLQLRRDAAGALGPVLSLMNAGGSGGAGTAIEFSGYNTQNQPATARIQSLDDGNFSSHLAFSAKKPGAAANALVEALRITADGNLGVGTPTPATRLDVNGVVRAQGPFNAAKDADSKMSNGGNLVIKGNAPQIDFVDTDHNDWSIHVNSNKMYFIREPWNFQDLVLDGAGNVGIGTDNPGVKLEVSGVVRARAFVETGNPFRHRMYPADPLVYQDIFEARDKFGAIKKLGGGGYNDRDYAVNLWNDRRIIMFGNDNEADGNGAEIAIPAGYDTVWVRVLGERWTHFHAYFLDGGGGDLGVWAGGYRSTNNYCPDGSLSDGWQAVHQWVPIPTRRAGRLALVPKAPAGGGFWLSGLAFSRNPWAHAAQPAVSYWWKSNGGGGGMDWADQNWNNDHLARILAKGNNQLMVPVVPSGRDKLLYLIEHNNNWNGASHSGITVNGKPIERFIASYDNPFARHWSSKFYERYLAARIPADMIGDARYLTVKIDVSKQADPIHFREIGTHDLDLPLPG